MGFSLKRAAKAVSTGGLSEVGGLFKKKGGGDMFDPYRMRELDPELKKNVQEARLAQRKTLADIMATSGKDIPGIQRAQVAREMEGISAAGEDAARKVRDTMAQRGMGKSSIGLGLEKGIEERAAQQKAATMAGLSERIRNMKEAQQARQLSAANQVLGTPGAQRDVMLGRKGQKKSLFGSIAPIAGAGIGAFFGGPQGAAAGMQMGQGVGQAYNNY